jgi:hypothetical protein
MKRRTRRAFPASSTLTITSMGTSTALAPISLRSKLGFHDSNFAPLSTSA